MADRKITDLTALAAGSQATGDLLTIVDVSEGAAADKNKSITVENLFKGIPGDVGIGVSAPSYLVDARTASGNAQIHLRSGGDLAQLLLVSNDTSGTSQINFGDNDANNVGIIQYAHSDNSLRLLVNSSERARIDSSGRLLLGVTSSRSVGFAHNLQIEGTNAASSSQSFIRNTNDSSGPNINFAKTRGTSTGSNTVVQSGDTLGNLVFRGADGTDKASIAVQIQAQVDGTPGSNDMPGRLVFKTTADGASSPTERLRIDSSGNVGIGTSSPDYSLTIGDGSSYVIQNLKAATDEFCEFRFGDTDSVAQGKITYDNGTDSLRVTVNASERMRIDSSGKVGVGTSSPGHKFHVVSSDTTTAGFFQLSDTTTTLGNSFNTIHRTGNDGDDRYSLSAWQVQNASGLTQRAFIGARAVTGASNYNPSMVFGTTTGSGTYSTRMVIGSNGNIGVGVTPTSGTKFYVQGFQIAQGITGEANGTNSFYGVYGVANNGAATQYGLYGQTNTSTSYSSGGILGYSTQSNTYGIVGYYDTSSYYSFYGNGAVAGTSFPNVSDSRLKDVDSNLTGCLDKLANIQPVKYTWKENSQQRRSIGTGVEIGLLAQEVQAQFPELVSDMGWCEVAGNNPETLNEQLGTTLSVDYGRMTAVLIQALNEAKEQIDTLKARVAALEAG